MSMLLSYLAPKIVTAEMLASAIGGGDMLINKWCETMPDDVRRAWLDAMRPALQKWLGQLQEKTR